uniref:Peptidase S1 domain-containing protein n=1 Tax=Panagrolaimus sp. JU765 TaxID=591449 RepID=A0AC34R2L6_9BILA
MNRWIFLAALFCAVAGSRQFRNNARSLNGSPYGQVEQHKAVQNGQIDPKKMVEVKLSAPLAYAANCTSSDVVVLELEEQLASPGAQLNTQENPTTGSFFASGFGEDPKEPEASLHLLKTVILDIKVCPAGHGYHDSICTVEITRDVCAGDSGSGLKDDSDTLFGLVSSGVDCSRIYAGIINSEAAGTGNEEYKGGIFTAVNKHLDFICSVIGNIAGCKPEFAKGEEKFITIA